MSEYIVSQQTARPRTIAAVHARIAAGSVARVFGQYLDQVYAAGRSGDVSLDGQNVFLYRCIPDLPGKLDVAFGVGVAAPFIATGVVQPTALPVGEVATTTHFGSYAKMGAAHAAVHQWCAANGRVLSSTSWEVYGHWTDDEAKLRTDIYYLLESGDAAR